MSLIRAAVDGDLAKVKQFILAGADLEVSTGSGSTPLNWASDGGHTDCVAALIEARANIEARDIAGSTPLHWACWRGHTKSVAALIEAGADVQARSNGVWIPPHYADRNGRINYTAALIDADVSRALADKEGKIPVDLTANPEILILLESQLIDNGNTK